MEEADHGTFIRQTSFHCSLTFTGKPQHGPQYKLVGSINGLICLSSYEEDRWTKPIRMRISVTDRYKLVLCNPILGSHFFLPDPPRSAHLGKHEIFGFGYIPSTRQYKAVEMVYMGHHHQKHILFHVCTIHGDRMNPSASAWKTIHYDIGIGLPLSFKFRSSPAFIDGSIIWIAEPYSDTEGHTLIYFDIEKEQMGTLSSPPTLPGDDYVEERANLVIGVYYNEDGKDQFYICEELCTCANIWVLEDYRCMDSLKLKWTVELPEEERHPVKLFRVLKDGRLLIGIKKTRLVYYDPMKGIAKQWQIYDSRKKVVWRLTNQTC